MLRSNKNFEAKKEALILIALDLFTEKGYENTTITNLQKAFGLTKGGMYHYFSSKEEILDAVIEQGLQQGIEEIKTRMNSLPLEDKLIYFFFHGAKNKFTQTLYRYKDNKNSIVAYKLRARNVEIIIPTLKELICLYRDAGIYESDYPEEMAEFCAILAKAIVEDEMLPNVNISQRKRRVDALIYLWDCCMKPPSDHLEQIRTNLYKIIEDQVEIQ